MGTLLILLRAVAIALALLAALLLHGLWRLARARSPWPRILLGTIGRIAGARRRVVGTPLRRDVVFLANHLSWLDILTLAGATGTAFVAKGELAGVPLIGWLCSLNRTIFVARGERMGVGAQVAAIRDAMAAGWAVTIFPEGTTGDGAALRPFKSALLSVLEPPPPGIRVQPVRIDYGPATRDIAWQGETGPANVARVLSRRRPVTATLTFCPPFDPADHPGRKAIAAEAQARIAAVGGMPAAPAGPPARRPA